MSQAWFENWFGEAYKELYPHRNFSQAEAQVTSVSGELGITPAWRILDIGCGQGRHLEMFQRMGFSQSVGLDLSNALLKDARENRLNVVRADMRHLPFRNNTFDLVTSFFTSFGYFATLGEDVNALSQFVSMLKPGGTLFLDLMNKDFLLNHLNPENSELINGQNVCLRRRVEWQVSRDQAGEKKHAVVVKEITIKNQTGASQNFQERVRLFALSDMEELSQHFGLSITKIYGDEHGGSYHPTESPRMALFLKRSSEGQINFSPLERAQ